jgi:beta-glucosidase
VSAFDDAAAAVRAGADPRKEAAALVAQMTHDERMWCLDGDLPFWAGLGDLGTGGYHKRPFPAARVERLGIPGFAFSDGPRGVVIGPATCFPVSMARGATWDIDLEERIGDAIGRELRAVGADLYGGVCVNVLRHPAWGRAQETYGEDPHHVGELGAALTRGVQRHAMACVKHFACNSMENARFKVDVRIDEQALHEVYLPHFRRIVDEGVAVVMSAYNAVNGDWCGESRPLLTEVLRDEWGFEGFVISDWIFGMRTAGPSLAGGLDVEMPYRMIRAHHLQAALDAGEVSPDDVDTAVVHVVSTLLRFHDVLQQPAPAMDVLACSEHRALAREAATKSIVLLRNEPVDGTQVLPLDGAALHRVAVIGRLADVRNLGDGGSSDVWAPEVVTALDGLRAALPGVEVVHDDGTDPSRAAAAADAADVAIVVAGYTREDEGEFIGTDGTSHLTELMPGPDDPDLAARFTASIDADPGPEASPGVSTEVGGFSTGGDRAELTLHRADEDLILAVAATNPRTVVAIVAGSAVVVERWIDAAPAVVQAWYSGMEGGHALADVLLGRSDASGRLPFTVPNDPAFLPPFDRDADTAVYDEWHGWWKFDRDGNRPAFPFGFGLSYTSFELGPFRIELGDDVTARGTVRNTGARDGVDVVQLYGGRVGARPRLLGFARVDVAAGGEGSVEIVAGRDRLARRDASTHRWVVDPGDYEFWVARHAADPDAPRVTVGMP